jgi:polyferredoxin
MKNMQGKIKSISILRRVSQVAAFLLFPGLFILMFSAIKDVYVALLNGVFSFADFMPQILLLIAMIIVTLVWGRFFCGFICSFGAMSDLVSFLAHKIVKYHIRINAKVDFYLKKIKYLVLLLILITWTWNILVINSLSNPWTIFGMYSSLTQWPDVTYFLSWGGLFLLLIIVGSIFIERFFCRYLCPLGAVFALLARLRYFKIIKPRTQCGACKLCTNKCAMGIELYKTDKITSVECINCLACVQSCPRKNIIAKPIPSIAATAAIVTITGLYYAGSLTGPNNVAEAATTQEVLADSQYSQGQYTDGTYTGSASGYRGETEVQVSVENGNITNIEVLATDDDPEFFNDAAAIIINEIIESQSTEVEAVSGATFSSYAIINAVNASLGNTETDYEIVMPSSGDNEVASTEENTTSGHNQRSDK